MFEASFSQQYCTFKSSRSEWNCTQHDSHQEIRLRRDDFLCDLRFYFNKKLNHRGKSWSFPSPWFSFHILHASGGSMHSGGPACAAASKDDQGALDSTRSFLQKQGPQCLGYVVPRTCLRRVPFKPYTYLVPLWSSQHWSGNCHSFLCHAPSSELQLSYTASPLPLCQPSWWTEVPTIIPLTCPRIATQAP